MQVAIAQLRRAARTANALEKLEALEMAEQKLRDAQWLSPETDPEQFCLGLTEIGQSRERVLKQAITAINRLLEVAEKGLGDSAEMLAAAARLLSFLNHYLPEDPRVEELNARFLKLGGKQEPYVAVPALADMYQRPAPGIGCGSLIGLLLVLLMLLVH